MSWPAGEEPATVDIADVVPGAVRVRAHELRKGDWLFDVFGGRHEIAKVRRYKRHVYTTRHDGTEDEFEREETITTLPREYVAAWRVEQRARESLRRTGEL